MIIELMLEEMKQHSLLKAVGMASGTHREPGFPTFNPTEKTPGQRFSYGTENGKTAAIIPVLEDRRPPMSLIRWATQSNGRGFRVC